MSCFEKKCSFFVLVSCLAVGLSWLCSTSPADAAESVMLLHSPLPETRATESSITKKTYHNVGLNSKGDLVFQHGKNSLILAYNTGEYNPKHHASISPDSIKEPLPPSGGISLSFSIAFN
jgi:hypothetical protein